MQLGKEYAPHPSRTPGPLTRGRRAAGAEKGMRYAR